MPTIECQKNASDRINTKNHQKQKQYKKSLLIRVPRGYNTVLTCTAYFQRWF